MAKDPTKYSHLDAHVDKLKDKERAQQLLDDAAKVQASASTPEEAGVTPDPAYVQDGRINNGGARPGAGRPKSKIKIDRDTVMRQLHECGADPIQFMIDMMMDPDEDKDRRLACAKELPQYYIPKLKSIEHKPSDDLLSGGIAIVKFSKRRDDPIDVGEVASKLLSEGEQDGRTDSTTEG